MFAIVRDIEVASYPDYALGLIVLFAAAMATCCLIAYLFLPCSICFDREVNPVGTTTIKFERADPGSIRQDALSVIYVIDGKNRIFQKRTPSNSGGYLVITEDIKIVQEIFQLVDDGIVHSYDAFRYVTLWIWGKGT